MNNDLAANLDLLHADAFGWALHCCQGDYSRAEDVLQDAYLKLACGRASHDGHSTFKTWWFGVIRFTAQEEFRRLRYRESLVGRLLQHILPTQDEGDPRPSPSRQIELNEQSQHVRQLLAQLPARQAEVLHLVFYQDLTLAHAATIMGVTIGSARQHYERGKARLRLLMQDTTHPLNHE